MIFTYLLAKCKLFFSQFSAKDLIYLFIIICLLTLTHKGCGRKDPNVEIKKPAMAPTEQKVDKKGTVYTKIEGTMYTQEQMKHVTDSFQKVLKNGKVLQVITAASAPIHDTVKVPVQVDTANHLMSATDSTKFYTLTFAGNWKTKIGRFTFYLAPDTATYITTWKTHIFKRDELSASVYHTDTLFKPVMGDVYTAKAPRALIDFDVFTGYDLLHMQPCIAIGAGIHIFSIKTKN